MPLLRAQAIVTFAQVENRSVVEHLALVVAPNCVGNPARFDLGHVTCNQSIQERCRIWSCNPVLRHR